MDSENQLERHELVAIMFADIVDYTSTMQRSESAAKRQLYQFQKTLEKVVGEYDGVIANFYGDGCLAKFKSAESAVRAASQMQREFLSEKINIPVRIGIHLGEVFHRDGNIYGDSVNLTSRIESFAVPGSVMFSDQINDQIKNKDQFQVKALGKVLLKGDNISRNLFVLADDGLIVPSIKEIKGKGKLNSKYSLKLLLGGGILFILGLIAYFILNETKTIENQELTIAVLPLLNLSNTIDDVEYFSDGLTQELVDELAKIHLFHLTPFTQSLFYKKSSLSPAKIAEELGVRYLISGSARLSQNGEIKLSIELFDPKTKNRIWNRVFEEPIMNSPMLQKRVARMVADHLEIKLTEKEEKALNKLSTNNGEAFRLFLKAKGEMDKFTEPSFQKARIYLNSAIELDSNYAQAYTLKAWSLILSADPQINPDANQYDNQVELSRKAIEKSLDIDPDLSDSYLVRSSVTLFGENNIANAQLDVEKAIELKSWPRVPTNYCSCILVSVYRSGHRFEQAFEVLELSQEIDPQNILLDWDKASIFLARGQKDSARVYFEKAYDEYPLEAYRVYLGMTLFHQEKFDEALKVMLDTAKDNGIELLLSLAYLSNIHYKLGDIDKSEDYLNEILARKEQGNINVHLSIVYLARNDFSTGMKYLKKAYALNEYGIAVAVGVDPSFTHLSELEEFRHLKQSMSSLTGE